MTHMQNDVLFASIMINKLSVSVLELSCMKFCPFIQLTVTMPNIMSGSRDIKAFITYLNRACRT